jgi:hypothetical protein
MNDRKHIENAHEYAQKIVLIFAVNTYYEYFDNTNIMRL